MVLKKPWLLPTILFGTCSLKGTANIHTHAYIHTHMYTHMPTCPGQPFLNIPVPEKSTLLSFTTSSKLLVSSESDLSRSQGEKANYTIYNSRRRTDGISPKGSCTLKAWLMPDIWKSNSRPSSKIGFIKGVFLASNHSFLYLQKKKKALSNVFYCSPTQAVNQNKNIPQYIQTIL